MLDMRQRNPSLPVSVFAKAFDCSVRTVVRNTKGWKPYAHEQK